jgi:hypothetical protein
MNEHYIFIICVCDRLHAYSNIESAVVFQPIISRRKSAQFSVSGKQIRCRKLTMRSDSPADKTSLSTMTISLTAGGGHNGASSCFEREQAKGHSECGNLCDENEHSDVESVIKQRRSSDKSTLPVECLKPLLFSMKLCGLYYDFKPISASNDGPVNRKQPTDCRCNSSWMCWHSVIFNLLASSMARLSRLVTVRCGQHPIYPTLVVVLLWTNVVRFFPAFFTRCDVFGQQLINKLSTFVWMILCAIFQTTYYVSCRTGRLRSVLDVIQPMSSTSIAFVRRRAIVGVATCWTMLIVNEAFFVYILFFGNGAYDFLVTPFFTHIPLLATGPHLTAVKLLILVPLAYSLLTWSLTVTSNHILAVIISQEFENLNSRFKQAIDDDGRFTGNLSDFRRRHQALSRYRNPRTKTSYVLIGRR